MSGPAVGKGKRDAGGDIVMGEVAKAILAQTDRGAEDSESVDSSPAGLWALHEQYAQVAGALQALAKGKGKGRGKGPPAASSTGGTKGSGKAGGKSNGKGDDFFDGNCHHCGKYGHRKIACRQLDREVAAKRADGKGKGRGLNEIIDDEEEPWQAGAEVNNETEAEWSFGIGCVSKGWPDAAAAPDLRPSRTMAPAGPSRLPPPHGPLWTTAGRARRPQPRAVTFADYAAAAAGPRVGSQKEKALRRTAPSRRGPSACGCQHGDVHVGCLTKGMPGALHGALVGAATRSGKVVEAIVDSGAEESVCPLGFFDTVMEPSPMSKTGARYRAANGSRIKNFGQQRVAFVSAEGHRCEMPFQVAEVERPLISVAALARPATAWSWAAAGARS